MPIRPLASASEATTRLMACMSPWSHMRRRNPRGKKLTCHHLYLHLHLSHPRKSQRLSYWRMMLRRRRLKRMS